MKIRNNVIVVSASAAIIVAIVIFGRLFDIGLNITLILGLVTVALMPFLFKMWQSTLSDGIEMLRRSEKGAFQFLRNNTRLIIWCITVSVLAFGYEITTFTLSLDEERLYMDARYPYRAPAAEGRSGIALLKRILMEDKLFPPFFATCVAVMALIVAALLFCKLLDVIFSDIKVGFWTKAVFCGVFLSYPIVHPDYIIFNTISIELAIGYVFVGCSMLALAKFFTEKKWSCIFIAIISMGFACSIYQALAAVYITIAVFSVLCMIINDCVSEKSTIKDYFIKVGIYISVLLASLVVFMTQNFLAQKVLGVAGSAYIDGFVVWNPELGFFQQLKDLISDILIYYSKTIYGNKYFLLSFVVLTVAILFSIILLKKYRKCIFAICGIAFALMPFSLCLVTGRVMPSRTMMALPVFAGAVWVLLLQILKLTDKGKALRCAAILSAVLVTFLQAQVMNDKFYNDHKRYERDLRIAEDISYDIDKFTKREYPARVVFVGNINNENTGVLYGEVLGTTYWNYAAIQNRLGSFLQYEGYQYRVVSATQDDYAQIDKLAMQAWPNEGYIAQNADTLYVKLS